VCRPPIAQERLVETRDGRLRYLLKKPWSDGTVALVLEPLDLCARVAALIPPPRFHMVRYHGVLSSHAKHPAPEDERGAYVLGIVLEPERVDAQQDIYSAAEVREAAHRFMEEYRNLGLMHR
jgi:hypothetical protein